MPALSQTGDANRHNVACVAREVSTDDADCLARSISGWSQKYEQLKAGHFQGSLSELCLGPAQIFLETTSHALRQECTVPANHVWFGLPRCENPNLRVNGALVQPGRIAVQRGGTPFQLVTPDDLQFYGIVVSEDLLTSYARQFERESWLTAALDRPVLDVSESTKQTMQGICEEILAQPRKGDGYALSPSLRQSLAEETLSALVSLFSATEPAPRDKSSGQQRQRLVDRADSYVREHSDRLITVSELCTVLNASRRALQIGFQDVLGISPHAYIRAVSLNGVRSHLRDPESPYGSVQDAAAAFGFWHMSQFALDYRELFGERPSETFLRRKRPLAQ